MKRGEDKTWSIKLLKMVVNLRRSSDGQWTNGGKPVTYIGLYKTHHPELRGFHFNFGEYKLAFMTKRRAKNVKQ